MNDRLRFLLCVITMSAAVVLIVEHFRQDWQSRNPEPVYFGFCKEGVSILFKHRDSEEESERKIKAHAERCNTCRNAMEGLYDPEPDFILGEGW